MIKKGQWSMGTIMVDEDEVGLSVRKHNGESIGEGKDGYWGELVAKLVQEHNASVDYSAAMTNMREFFWMKDHIHKLQEALSFWIPRVPANESDQSERIANDAMLLIAFEGDMMPCAEDRGWITLNEGEQ